MTRRRARGGAVQGLALAGLLAFCGALITTPAAAFEPSPGNKNFTSPNSAPDYFSNEAAPFGRASHPATQGADRFNAAPIGADRGHASISQPTNSSNGRHVASSYSRHAHAGHARGRSARVYRYARAASHYRISARHRAATSHPRYAAHSARHSRRIFR